jgi:hypothetical protein
LSGAAELAAAQRLPRNRAETAAAFLQQPAALLVALTLAEQRLGERLAIGHRMVLASAIAW